MFTKTSFVGKYIEKTLSKKSYIRTLTFTTYNSLTRSFTNKVNCQRGRYILRTMRFRMVVNHNSLKFVQTVSLPTLTVTLNVKD